MAVSLTAKNKKTLKRALKTGHWNNESEVIRYSLRLLERELDAENRADLSPLPPGVLAEAYPQQTAEEKAAERRMAKASLRHYPKPEELDS